MSTPDAISRLADYTSGSPTRTPTRSQESFRPAEGRIVVTRLIEAGGGGILRSGAP